HSGGAGSDQSQQSGSEEVSGGKSEIRKKRRFSWFPRSAWEPTSGRSASRAATDRDSSPQPHVPQSGRTCVPTPSLGTRKEQSTGTGCYAETTRIFTMKRLVIPFAAIVSIVLAPAARGQSDKFLDKPLKSWVGELSAKEASVRRGAAFALGRMGAQAFQA